MRGVKALKVIAMGGVIAGMSAPTAFAGTYSQPGNWNNGSFINSEHHKWDTPPPSDKVVVDVVSVNGSGCPNGTAAVSVSPDNTAFTVTYSNYMAQVGPNAKPTDFRKNCQLGIVVHVPSGFTYAIAQADYRGYAHLEPGASGQERANYYFQGMSETKTVTHKLQGAYDDDWENTDTTDVGSLSFEPCGEERNFNINTELRVNQGTSDPSKTSFMTMDSTDNSLTTTYHFAWETCGSSTGGNTGGNTGGDNGGNSGGNSGGDNGGYTTGGDNGGNSGGDNGGYTTGGDNGGNSTTGYTTGGDNGGDNGGWNGGNGGWSGGFYARR